MKTAVAFSILFFSAISFAAPLQQRIVLIEEYSASTCPPCATFNTNYFVPFLKNTTYQGKYTCVNFRANWPGAGDPYYTAESGICIKFYPEVSDSGVPQCYFDAKPITGWSASVLVSGLNSAAAKAAKAAITAQHTISGTTAASGKVKVLATITPTQTIAGANLYIAVCEKLTTKNASTNGEKEFHHVMMKMVPNASGRALTLTANTAVTIKDSANLSGTHIEEMTDLEVIVWAQITSSKEVLQSALSVEGSVPVAEIPSVASNKNILVHQDLDGKNIMIYNADNSIIQIQDISGKCIEQMKSAAEVFNHSIAHLARGCYLLRVTKGNVRYSKMILVTH